MNSALRNDGILDAIRSLSAQGATGQLQISTGMTDGALSFDRGELVDARLANLRGFQAINAIASMPDAGYSFDPTILPSARSSISANERMLLKDFFGIEAGNEPPLIPDNGSDDETTLVRSETENPEPIVAAPLAAEPVIAEPVITESVVTEPVLEEPHFVDDVQTPLPVQPLARPMFPPALFFVLLAALVALAAIALAYRLRKPEPAQPVAATVETATPAPTAVPAAAEVPQPSTSNDITAAVPNLSGNWSVVNTVDQTSYQAYKNMKVGFNVAINQTGKSFTGKGEKVSENGQSLPATSRTPIEVKGTIDGDKVEATFSESGALRKTNGRFVWRIDKASGGLTGTFVSSAARTRGRSAAKKGS